MICAKGVYISELHYCIRPFLNWSFFVAWCLVTEQDLDDRVRAALEEIKRTQRALADKAAKPLYADSVELLRRKYRDIGKR